MLRGRNYEIPVGKGQKWSQMRSEKGVEGKRSLSDRSPVSRGQPGRGASQEADGRMEGKGSGGI